jgi:hypothetical protein
MTNLFCMTHNNYQLHKQAAEPAVYLTETVKPDR